MKETTKTGVMLVITIFLIAAGLVSLNGINDLAGWVLIVVGSLCALVTMGTLSRRPQ